VLGVLEGAPKYLVREQLSAGGMGAVHLGTMVTPAGERQVAIKRLLDGALGSPEAKERIVAEARLVFQLTHANICQVLDLASNAEGTFIVMEYVDGCDLATLLSRAGGSLDVAAAVHIAREVCKALDYAHRRADASGGSLFLVHDVKPSNILLSKEGEVRLGDFGIARSLTGHAPGNRVVGGTPGFIAPEARHGQIDQRSDIYALGVTLYAALGGTPATLDLHALKQRPSVASELVAIVERAIAANAQDRYATAGALEKALSLHLAHKFPSFTPQLVGELVRTHAPKPATAGERSLTLMSLTQIDGADTLEGRAPPFPSEPAPLFQRTAPAAPRRAHQNERKPRWRWAVIPACLAGAVGAAIFYQRHPQSATAASSPPVVAPATSVVPPVPEVAPTAPPIALPPPAPPKRNHAPFRKANAEPKSVPSPSVPTEVGFLTVNADPWGAVYVDGKRLAEATPAYRVAVAAGTHRVTVQSPERKARAPERVVEIRAGELSKIGFKW
jgi:serine/threonine-protein kinase